jgi:hypothetical protein
MLDETDEVRSGPGCHKALGGHLHISGVAVDGVFLAALDKFVAVPLNEVSNIQLRKSRGYGQLSVIDRVKSHGGVEYRSPPSWISTPDIAKGVIAIAWVLANLQKHGHIDQIQTFEDFFQYPRKGNAKAIKKFTTVLAELKQRGIKLENIEVLKAWEKTHLLKPIKKRVRYTRKKPTPPVRLLPVDWALNDSYLPDIAEQVGQLLSPIALRIVGAHQVRSPRRNTVYLPEGWSSTLPGFRTIAIEHWSLPSIGLSWSLRQDVPLAAAVVRALVGSVRLCA